MLTWITLRFIQATLADGVAQIHGGGGVVKITMGIAVKRSTHPTGLRFSALQVIYPKALDARILQNQRDHHLELYQ